MKDKQILKISSQHFSKTLILGKRARVKFHKIYPLSFIPHPLKKTAAEAHAVKPLPPFRF